MHPSATYDDLCHKAHIQSDAAQRTHLPRLDTLYNALIQPSPRFNWMTKPNPPKGIYLQGSVGTGKTLLMDAFFYGLPLSQKLRFHFHSFMRMIHDELHYLQGKKNPLQHLAKGFAKRAKIICLDELLVDDIADAMLLAGVFEAFYRLGVCFVFTSNLMPDELYRNGLQRNKFLPAIELIKTHNDILKLNLTYDYRQLNAEKKLTHSLPQGKIEQIVLENLFSQAAKTTDIIQAPLALFGRNIPCLKRATDIIWFDFQTLCGTWRAKQDYIEISKRYKVVILDNMPSLDDGHLAEITRFIHLVDVFYDAKTRFILSSEGPPETLYRQGKRFFDYARTCSRLQEMQSWTEVVH